MVAVEIEVLFTDAVRPTAYHGVADIKRVFVSWKFIKKLDDGIESIDQSKIDSSLNFDSKGKESVCYFFKSSFPTAQDTVNGRNYEIPDVHFVPLNVTWFLMFS